MLMYVNTYRWLLGMSPYARLSTSTNLQSNGYNSSVPVVMSLLVYTSISVSCLVCYLLTASTRQLTTDSLYDNLSSGHHTVSWHHTPVMASHTCDDHVTCLPQVHVDVHLLPQVLDQFGCELGQKTRSQADLWDAWSNNAVKRWGQKGPGTMGVL